MRLDEALVGGSLAQFVYINWSQAAKEQAVLEQAAERAIRLSYKLRINAYAFSLDGKLALTGCDDHPVRLWDLETRHCLRVFEGHTDEVNSVAWSSNERYVLSGATDYTARLWDADTVDCLRVLEGHYSPVWSVAWNADGVQALFASTDRTVRLWDVEMGCCLRALGGHTSWVFDVAWSADGADDNNVRQIVFQNERLDAVSVRRWRVTWA